MYCTALHCTLPRQALARAEEERERDREEKAAFEQRLRSKDESKTRRAGEGKVRGGVFVIAWIHLQNCNLWDRLFVHISIYLFISLLTYLSHLLTTPSTPPPPPPQAPPTREERYDASDEAVIKTLRDISRQEYLKKRELQKLEELRRDTIKKRSTSLLFVSL